MDEQERIQDLWDYEILGSYPDSELDELTQIASAICDTPIALVSLIDGERQWFKAKKGLDINGSPQKDAFCLHALHNPKEVLVVEDPLNDERFRENPFVQGQPHIRFYAGAPLETPKGNVIGTLCIIDSKPRTISENQKNALKLLAKKVMDYLNNRKLLIEQNEKIESSSLRLKKLADQAPGIIYQFEMAPDGEMSFPFISKGVPEMFPGISDKLIKDHPEIVFSFIHPDDIAFVQESIRQSSEELTNLDVEYRVVLRDSSILWHWGNAKPERKNDGTVVWYGTFQDLTNRKEYEQTLEQILSDISHVLRRPVTTMLAVTSLIEEDNLNEEMIREYARNLKVISEEMDDFTKKLNNVYHLKMQKSKFKTKNNK